MAAMMDTDEDAELALLGSEEDDEQTLRRFLDALPRDATKRDANVAAFLGETCPPAKLLLRAALWAVDGPVRATPSSRRLHKKRRATHQPGARFIFRFAHGAPAVRKETCARKYGQGRHHGSIARRRRHVGKAAVDDDAGVAESAANAARAGPRGIRRRGDRGGRRGHAGGARQPGARRACDVACGVAVACGDAAWDRRLIAYLHSVRRRRRGPSVAAGGPRAPAGPFRSRRAVSCSARTARATHRRRGTDDGYGATSGPCARLLGCSRRPTPIHSPRPKTAASRGF